MRICIFVFAVLLLSAPIETVLAGTREYEASLPTSHDIEARVRSEFADTPVMIEIARCESKFRQFRSDGSPLRGGLGNGMVGVFQFNEAIHTHKAASLGLDITTLEGNIGYAKHLYMMQSTDPWNSSRSCWSSTEKTQTTAADDREALLKKIATLKELIATLQQLVVLRQLALE